MNKKLLIALAILLVLALAAGAVYWSFSGKSAGSSGDRIYCGTDVKQCADGSYVSRDAGNHCEFRACP